MAIDAEAHDRLLATVSHLPHVLANVLVGQAARRCHEEDAALPRVGPSFRDATRVAGRTPPSGPTSTWPTARRSPTRSTHRARLQVAAILRAGDPHAVTAWNERAADDRRRLLEADLAGGTVRELRLTVPNRPGIVAQVALALGKAGVNILDLALAPHPTCAPAP